MVKDMKIFIEEETGEFWLVGLSAGATLTGYIGASDFHYYPRPENGDFMFKGDLRIVGKIPAFNVKPLRGKALYHKYGDNVKPLEGKQPSAFPNSKLDVYFTYTSKEGKEYYFAFFDPQAFLEQRVINAPKSLGKRHKKKWWEEHNLFQGLAIKETEAEMKSGKVNKEKTHDSKPIELPKGEEESEEAQSTEEVPDNEKDDRPSTPTQVRQAQDFKTGTGNIECKLADKPDGYLLAHLTKSELNEKENIMEQEWMVAATPTMMNGRTLYLIFPNERQAKTGLEKLKEDPYYANMLQDFDVQPMEIIDSEFRDVGSICIKNVYTFLEGLNAYLKEID